MGHGSALSPSMWPLVLFLWVLVLVLFNSPGLLVWQAVPVWFPVCAAGCRPPSRFWTTVFLQDRHREFITPHPSNSEATDRETTGVFVEALSRQDPGFRPVYVDRRATFGAKRSNIILLIARLNKGWHHVATCVRRYWADVTLKLKCVLSADGWSGMEAITHQTHRGRHVSNTKFMIHKQLLI